MRKVFSTVLCLFFAIICSGQVATTDTGNVNYKYYEGSFTKLPDFTKLTPYKVGKTKNFKLGTGIERVQDNFAILFESYIKIDSTGTYSFGITSDDGSKLMIDTTVVVNHDGLHSSSYKEGTIKLNKGTYRITVQYFEASGSQVLDVYWKPVGKTTKTLIPNYALVPPPIVIPPSTKPKEIGRFKFVDIEIILLDNLTWEYLEQIQLK